MKSTFSPEETKQHHIDRLGAELGTIYNALWNEMAWLNSKWDEYVTLFATKSSRIELLNSSASLFFMIVQKTLWNDTLLHIYRLTCPSSSGRGKDAKDQLTIKKLPDLVDDAIRETISNQVGVAVQKSEFAHEWRHNKIAHPNLALALNPKANQLPAVTVEKVNNALASIVCVLNTISEHYFDSPCSFEVINQANGAEALLYVLNDGLKAEEQRSIRFKEQSCTPDDLKVKEL